MLNNRLADISKKAYEVISFLGVTLFALLPLIMFCGPEKYGDVFRWFAFAEIFALMICIIVYLVFFAVVFFRKSPGEAFSNLKRSITDYFSNRTYAILFLAILVISVISAFRAPDTLRALAGKGIRPDGLLMYFCFASLFVFASSLKKNIYKRIVIGCYILSFLAVSLVMVQQYYGVIGTAPKADTPSFLLPLKELYSELGFRTGHFYKGLTGTFYNSNHLGYYIAICSCMFSGFFVCSKKLLSSILLLFLTAFSYWVLILNDTFGTFIAVAITIVIYTIFFVVKCKAPLAKSVLPLVLFVCICLSVSIPDGSGKESIIGSNLFHFGEDIKKVVESEDKSDVSAGSGRWNLWVGAADMIAEKPLLGHGPDNIKEPSIKYDMKMDRSHNEFLEISSALGVPAAFFYYMGLISAIIYAMKRKNTTDISVGASMAVCAYLISSLVGVFLFYTAFHLFIMLGFVGDDTI